MEARNGITKAVLIIALIGAVNWGLIGFFNWNLVDAIFGGGAHEQTSAFSRVIYAIVGLAGVAGFIALFRPEGDRIVRRQATA
jgi:uncharacterized membrane protein YuzA (DUF378 family)